MILNNFLLIVNGMSGKLGLLDAWSDEEEEKEIISKVPMTHRKKAEKGGSGAYSQKVTYADDDE